MIWGVDPTIYVEWRGAEAPFGRRHVRTVGDAPTQWRVAPSLITLTNDYVNYMIKLMIIINISQQLAIPLCMSMAGGTHYRWNIWRVDFSVYVALQQLFASYFILHTS
jgi:hypothetical protein